MKFIDIVQRSEAWHKWRKTGVTASESRILLDLDEELTIWYLWALKTGRLTPKDVSKNPLVIRGNRLEARARLCAEIVLSEPCLLPVCVQSSKHPIALASLDGITQCLRPFEAKVPSESCYQQVVSLGINSVPYLRYIPQVQHQLLITESDFGWLMFYNPNDTGDYRIFRVNRNEDMIAKIIDRMHYLWELVLNDQPPELDPNRDVYMPASDREVRAWCHHSDYLRKLDVEQKELLRRVETLKQKAVPHRNSLIQLMGNYARADYAGVSLTRVAPKGEVDYAQILSDKGISVSESDANKYRKSSKKPYYRVSCSEQVMPKNFAISEITRPLVAIGNHPTSNYF